MKTLGIFLFGLTLWARTPVKPTPNLTIPPSFQNLQASQGAAVSEKWWMEFGDPLLNELMEKTAAANIDVKRAAARVAEARAQEKSGKSALLPNLDLNFAASQVRGGVNQGVVRASSGSSFISGFETGVVSTGLQSRWEADVFGGLRREYAATKADAVAALNAREDVIRMARADVARNYVEMRGYEDQLLVVREQARAERDLLELLRDRTQAGLASQLDVERQQSQVSNSEARIPDLDALRLQAAYRIAVLLGDPPTALTPRLNDQSTGLKRPAIPESIPSDLLRRRPDLRRADEEINAAFARAGAAHAELYPKFSFTGQSGRQGVNLAGLAFGAGNFFSVGPTVSLPIFEGGRIRARIAARQAQLDEAVHAYEGDVLAAFEETENALVARDRSEQRERSLDQAVKSASESVELARELYIRGLGDFLSVLDAQREVFRAQQDLAAARTAVLRSSVSLYRSLGL